MSWSHDGNPMLDELALLLLEHMPAQALPASSSLATLVPLRSNLWLFPSAFN